MASIDLTSLFERIDDWFTDITLSKPLKHFILDEDRARLATISRTTGIWFKSLTSNPPLTSEGIEDFDLDDSKHDSPRCNKTRPQSVQAETKRCRHKSKQNKFKARGRNEEQKFDLLVKDLESLLDQKEEKDSQLEPELIFFNFQNIDELSLQDGTLGSCCTIESDSKSYSPERDRKVEHDVCKEYSVVFEPIADEPLRRLDSCRYRTLDLNRQHSVPIDHDYLARPYSRPLVSNNRQFQHIGLKLRSNRVLNTEALKRFAPFSNKIKNLIDKHAKLAQPTPFAVATVE